MEILLISADFSTENGLFLWNWEFPGDKENSENMYLMYTSTPQNPRPQLQAFNIILEAFHGGLQGWAGEFLRKFCKHKMGTIFVGAFS